MEITNVSDFQNMLLSRCALVLSNQSLSAIVTYLRQTKHSNYFHSCFFLSRFHRFACMHSFMHLGGTHKTKFASYITHKSYLKSPTITITIPSCIDFNCVCTEFNWVNMLDLTLHIRQDIMFVFSLASAQPE